MVSFILSLLMGFNAHANCEKRFVLGFVNTAPSYTVENGEKKGLSYELIQEVSRRLGCRSTEFTGPLAAVQEGLKKNSVDIYGLIAPSNYLEQAGDFAYVYEIPRTLIVHRNVYKKNNSIDDYLNDPKVVYGSVIGQALFLTGPEESKLLKAKRLKEYPSPKDAFNALNHGRIDAVWSTPLFTHYYLSLKNSSNNYVILPDPTVVFKSGFYLSKKRLSNDEKAKITNILHEMRTDGTLQRIATEYVDKDDLKYYASDK